MSIYFRLGLGFALALHAGNANAQSINYKLNPIYCTFTKECGEGHSATIQGNVVDKSQCLNINDVLTFDPATDTLTYRGTVYPPQYVEKRRRAVSVGIVIGSNYVNFSAGDQVPTLRYRDAPKGSIPITRYVTGTCVVATAP